MSKIPKTAELVDPSHTAAGKYLSAYEYPWQALAHIKDMILAIGEGLPSDEYDSPEAGVWIAKDAKVAPTAFIGSPCIIGHGTEVRHCAFVRGSALVGDGAVIGNSVELKNCIISDGAQVPHYNYVGDSILGYRSHMGAGSVTSNVKSDKTPVSVRIGDDRIDTGLKKFGAILGNFCEIGCGAVLNPGTVIGPRTSVYPQVSVRGYVPEDCIVKSETNIIKRRA